MGRLADSRTVAWPLRAVTVVSWVVAGFGGLWVGAAKVRARLVNRYGRPVRRLPDVAQVPTDALDVIILATPAPSCAAGCGDQPPRT